LIGRYRWEEAQRCVWTIDDKEAILQAQKMKVDNITTNTPKFAKTILNGYLSMFEK